jgi:hypothetical protein
VSPTTSESSAARTVAADLLLHVFTPFNSLHIQPSIIQLLPSIPSTYSPTSSKTQTSAFHTFIPSGDPGPCADLQSSER